MSLNFFSEYHGKRIIDDHFQKVNQWLSIAADAIEIDTIDKVIKALKLIHAQSNASKTADNLCAKESRNHATVNNIVCL